MWFIILTVVWTGFFVLEGFDFGVGMLHGIIGKDEPGRRAVISTIGPLWDGNEVWLIVAVAGTFAAFPGWYATMFSAFYLIFLLILAALIVRGVSFEFSGKVSSPRWRRTWHVGLTVASLVSPATVRHRARRPAARHTDQQLPGIHRLLLGSAAAVRDLHRYCVRR